MNLANLFANKNKTPKPEYFLAVEIHESLIKTALWEIMDGLPEVLNTGSFESWSDEVSLVNGIGSSLEQAVKIIDSQPGRVIFGLPNSWMEDDKIHPTKTKLITKVCKDLGLEPIGAVTTNRAISHYLKKREGMPPTVILLEVYTSKVAVSYVYLGEVQKTEEVARSGDLAHDVEEGLARMELPNYPARFVLTNGGSLDEESQQITAHPWTERLPFKHLPKVEVLPIQFSIEAIALTGGVEAVQFLGLSVNDASSADSQNLTDSNIVVPQEVPTTIEDLGFSYEEATPPVAVPVSPKIAEPKIDYAVANDDHDNESDPEYAFQTDDIVHKIKPPSRFSIKIPSIKLPKLSASKGVPFFIFGAVMLFVVGMASYLYFGSARVVINFNPQKITKQIEIVIAESKKDTAPTLIATKKTFSGTATESGPTTGTATVGEKATGKITIANKSNTSITLKAGTHVTNDTGKYSFTLVNSITVASASADPIDPVSGKSTGVEVIASRIGAEYNLTKDTIFTVDSYSKSITAAIAESDFVGGTSRTVNAVSKADQDKLLAVATEKIKQQIKDNQKTQSEQSQVLPLTEMTYTKKQFDHNVGEEATTITLNLEGSVESLVFSSDMLYQLVSDQIKDIVPAGSYITKETTQINLENPVLVGGNYQAKVSVASLLYPKFDQEKIISYIKGRPVSGLRHFFEPIPGFSSVDIKISPAIPFITRLMPVRNINLELKGNNAL